MGGSNKAAAAGHAEMMTHAADAVCPPARAGVSQSTTAPWTLDVDARVYADTGWSAVGVWLHKLERPAMDEFWFPEQHVGPVVVDAAAAAIARAGLAVSHLVLAGRFTEADDDVRARRVDHAVHAVEIAARLGSRCVVVIPGRLNGLTRENATRLAVSALEEVLARTDGVPLAIEPVQEVDFVTTLGEALDLADLVGDGRLGVFPDVFHLWREAGLTESLARAGDRIFGAHLADGSGADGDRTRLPPGEGALPLGEFVAAVDAAGYDGTYDVELFTMGSSVEEAGDVLARCAAGLHGVLA
jgi:sugar phosphate isomerase/epimerase